MDNSAVNLQKKTDNPTQPYNATVASENTGIEGKTSHASVYTQPLHATVECENTEIKQARLGRFICENCGKEGEKRIYSQRFCCSECRTSWHGYKLTAKDKTH